LILDWKTNRIEPDQVEKLRGRYRGQISAYWKAIAEITNQSVSAGVFLTTTGRFVFYDEEELEHEWVRLRSLPTDAFLAAIDSGENGPANESPLQLEFDEW
jgi:hypothetical protein